MHLDSLEDIDVKKSIQPKGLYFTRPAMWHYLNSQEAKYKMEQDKLFEAIRLGKIKVKIFKKYRLDEVVASS